MVNQLILVQDTEVWLLTISVKYRSKTLQTVLVFLFAALTWVGNPKILFKQLTLLCLDWNTPGFFASTMFECNICFETAFEPVVTRCGHLSEARIRWKNGSICVFLEGFCGWKWRGVQCHKRHPDFGPPGVMKATLHWWWMMWGLTAILQPLWLIESHWGSVGNVCICGFRHLEGLKTLRGERVCWTSWNIGCWGFLGIVGPQVGLWKSSTQQRMEQLSCLQGWESVCEICWRLHEIWRCLWDIRWMPLNEMHFFQSQPSQRPRGPKYQAAVSQQTVTPVYARDGSRGTLADTGLVDLIEASMFFAGMSGADLEQRDGNLPPRPAGGKISDFGSWVLRSFLDTKLEVNGKNQKHQRLKALFMEEQHRDIGAELMILVDSGVISCYSTYVWICLTNRHFFWVMLPSWNLWCILAGFSMSDSVSLLAMGNSQWCVLWRWVEVMAAWQPGAKVKSQSFCRSSL